MNPTDIDPGSQASNGYGRIPDHLWGKLLQLSPTEAKLFMLLSSKANRKREPLGLVDANISNIATIWMRSSPGAIRRYLKRLDSLGLIDYVYRKSPGGGGIRVRHYMDHHDPVDHSDPEVDHHDPVPDHPDPPPGSPRSTIGTEVVDSFELASPSNDKSNDSNSSRRRKPAPKVLWDSEERRAVAVDEKWKAEFNAHWVEELGELRLRKEMEKANNWLANPANAHRRAEGSRLDQFFWKWMGRCEK